MRFDLSKVCRNRLFKWQTLRYRGRRRCQALKTVPAMKGPRQCRGVSRRDGPVNFGCCHGRRGQRRPSAVPDLHLGTGASFQGRVRPGESAPILRCNDIDQQVQLTDISPPRALLIFDDWVLLVAMRPRE